jgi:RNA polymerase sigma-70 factor (ECF subfamily)
MGNMATKPSSTSTSLLFRLSKDDAEAWERFDSFYLPLVRRWCHRLQSADREEIAQQTAERVRGAIARFDRRRHGSFRAWLRTIVENLLKDFYRHSANAEPTMTDAMFADVTQPTETELDEEKRLQYQRAVGIMRRDFCEKWVRCFEGIVIYDLSARELADELGMTIDAVRTAKFKILKRLKEEFGDLLDE